MYDWCAEPYGFNRMEKESITDYIKRMVNCDRLYTREDYSMHEFVPKVMMKINSLLETHDHTFYFSISSSLKGKRLMTKQSEMLKEPKHTSKLGSGFDLEIESNLKFANQTSLKSCKEKRS